MKRENRPTDPGDNGIWIARCSPDEAARIAEARRDLGLTVRVIRGMKMATTEELMNEVSAALQFPAYFGENWPALDECLSELEWLLPSVGFAIVVVDSKFVLSGESPDQLESFVNAIHEASKTFEGEIDLGENWDRAALPFQLVLQATEADIREVTTRWVDAGASIQGIIPAA